LISSEAVRSRQHYWSADVAEHTRSAYVIDRAVTCVIGGKFNALVPPRSTSQVKLNGMFCTLYAFSNQDALGLLAGSREHQPRTLDACGLEKAWGAIHYFLSGSGDTSSDDPTPENFLLSGQALGYISEHAAVHTPEEVIHFAAMINMHSSEDLIARFDASRMNELDVYGGPWTESLREYVQQFLDPFRAFVLSAAEQSLAVLIIIG
jgi:hypothetical protein